MPTAQEGFYNTKYKTTNAAGTALTITMSPAAKDSPTVEAAINNEYYDKFANNKEIGSGDLFFVESGELLGEGFFIDEKTGELFASGETANNYSIPDPLEGMLVYTFR